MLSVYHHWNGGPNWLGRILKTHYNSKELAAELIDGGDMSCCWTKERWLPSNYKGSQHTNIEEYGPQYYSQRGEDCPPRYDKNLNEFLQNNEEYGYVFTETEGWLCYDTCDWHESYLEGVEIPYGTLMV